jgi:hypothetical protein
MDEVDEEAPRTDEERVPAAEREESYVGLDDEGAKFDDPPPRPPIEPESVDLEHAVFVVAGVALAVAIVAGLL